MKRILVVGDLHGGLRSFIQCLKRCNYNSHNDQIIFVGDYVDGWSESAELVQYIIELGKASRYDHIYIRGNHDEWCDQWFQTGLPHKMWVQQGGQSTIDSYIRTGYIVEDSHRNFFKHLINYYVDENNNVYVHGGFQSREGVGHEEYRADYFWDRKMWNVALQLHGKTHLDDEGNPVQMGFHKYNQVFIGHTATINWNIKRHLPEFNGDVKTIGDKINTPMNRCNVWNMDTGGGFGGKVTIMDVSTNEYWQSDLVGTLYPGEMGR